MGDEGYNLIAYQMVIKILAIQAPYASPHSHSQFLFDLLLFQIKQKKKRRRQAENKVTEQHCSLQEADHHSHPLPWRCQA
jgi:hypothetical protein